MENDKLPSEELPPGIEDMYADEIPFEDLSIEQLDLLLEDTNSSLMVFALNDIRELIIWSYALHWLVFGLLFFILLFVGIGAGKK